MKKYDDGDAIAYVVIIILDFGLLKVESIGKCYSHMLHVLTNGVLLDLGMARLTPDSIATSKYWAVLAWF